MERAADVAALGTGRETEMTLCDFAGCEQPMKARGLCEPHYARWWRTGSAEPTVRPSRDERFWTHVVKTDTCWLWDGAPSRKGYAQFRNAEGRQLPVHRYSYELCVGPVPAGMQLDHLCRVHHCVNPEHLEPVTPRENLMRGQTLAAANAAKTACKRGHPYTPENTYEHSGRRHCRPCQRLRGRGEI